MNHANIFARSAPARTSDEGDIVAVMPCGGEATIALTPIEVLGFVKMQMARWRNLMCIYFDDELSFILDTEFHPTRVSERR